MAEFRMPSLGADMEYGTIVEWRVRPGDTVRKGDIVAVVDTDKATIEVEVFEDGEIVELLVEPGREVPVGAPLARIAAGPAQQPRRARSKPRPVPTPAATLLDTTRSSPLARRIAQERGLDLAAVSGSGPGGAVIARDVRPRPSALEKPAARARTPEPGPEPTRGPKASAMRAAIGSLMARSKREIPHYYLATDIDMSRSMEWLTRHNADRPVTERVLAAALLLRASALAARQVPCVNGLWDDGFRPSENVHIGVAISLRKGGLVAPAIHDADQLALGDLMQALSDLVQRARTGSLRASEMSDPTITVTNLGDQGVDEVFGVIYPPQVAIVGFGKIVEKVVAIDGLIGARPAVRVSLAADHRVSDGHDGGRFLTALDKLLQDPEAL